MGCLQQPAYEAIGCFASGAFAGQCRNYSPIYYELHVTRVRIDPSHRKKDLTAAKNSFVYIANKLIADAEIAAKTGSRSASIVRDYKQRLNAYCIPFFGTMQIAKINHRKLKEFVAWLVDERELSAATIRAIMSFVSMVFRLAADEDVIVTIPRIPRPPQKDSPRAAFTEPEYQQLLAAMKKLETASPPVKVRAWPITSELREFTAFMVNSFLRPGDAISLRHRDVEEKVSPQGRPYLKMTSTSSKTKLDPVVTMPKAVEIYRRLKAKAAKRGLAGPDDFVFLPERKKRSFAMEVMRRQFIHVLEQEGLAKTNLGEDRTLYSLRHTAIMFRLLYGDLDLLTLARACRTSVEMIDRFYAKGLHAEMNIDRIHSMRPGLENLPL